MRIIEFLKQNKMQFYVIPVREIPIKAIIRGLPTSKDIEELKEILAFKGYTIIKISQQKSRRVENKLLPLFLVELPK